MVDGNLHIVAMPRWSSIVGVARLVIALLVLIFVSTAAGLWYSASYAAFGLTLFTVSAFANPCLTNPNIPRRPQH
jgi:uncharacterized membrane protein YkgB